MRQEPIKWNTLSPDLVTPRVVHLSDDIFAYFPNMKGAFHVKFLLLMLISVASGAYSQEFHSLDFASRMDSLIHGRIDSLALAELGKLQTVQFDKKGWQWFNEHEMKSAPDGQVFLDLMHPIVKDDIVSMNDHHWAVLLHEKNGPKIYLATISSHGVPLEGFLLHDHFGYLYEKTFRSYSFEHPVHFNPEEHAFEFYQVTYGYERIPTLESPTQDPIYHQSFHRVGIDERGQIEMRLSESTGNQLFRRAHVKLVQHELAFQEFSLWYVSEEGQPLSEIWDEAFLTHGDMDSHDSITIHLEFESRWNNRFFFLQPAEGTTIVEVAQRHENILSFPGDGSTCSLPQWKRFRSSWRDLHCEENFFQTVSLDSEERGLFSEYTQSELIEAFEEECGPVPSMESLALVMEPHPAQAQVVVDRIVLRVRFLNDSEEHDKYILLQLAAGC